MKRILHTMLRVGDMQTSIRFYQQVLGMKVLRTFDRPEEGYSLCFIGYGEEQKNSVIELTCNHGISVYDIGNAFGHIAIEVHDCKAACQHVKDNGGKIIREAGLLAGSQEVIAFITDPDGYKIELIEKNWAN
ncbi:MAG: lactoylglutathione lyase [Pseudomonadales bacterium]|nr:lactoylglutathione lyase [Pseudomonadales bacterium]